MSNCVRWQTEHLAACTHLPQGGKLCFGRRASLQVQISECKTTLSLSLTLPSHSRVFHGVMQTLSLLWPCKVMHAAWLAPLLDCGPTLLVAIAMKLFVVDKGSQVLNIDLHQHMDALVLLSGATPMSGFHVGYVFVSSPWEL